MDYETLIYQKRDGIAKIVLNLPEKLNAFGYPMEAEIDMAVEDAARDDEVRVLIITGAGRAFSAGGDFRYAQVRTREVHPEEAEIRDEGTKGRLIPTQTTFHAMLALERMEKPTIAMVNGPAAGGGFDLALACDLRIGSPNTRFTVGFTRIGLVPGTGGAWFLPRIVGLSKALELLYTSDSVDAEEAYRIGLLNKLVPAEKLEDETIALARKLVANAPMSLRLDKFLVYKGLNHDLETAIGLGAACEEMCLRSEDHLEGLMAFAEKRKPIFRGK
jgi:enoyl-CoA hydratase/carnithine racemase